MDENAETSRLVGPNNVSKTSYINIFGNILSLIFVAIVIYCSFSEGATLFSFHPTLMSIGWLVFMTSAINAITPGDLATEWMPIRLRSARHWVIQLFAGTIVLIGFIIIVSNKIMGGKDHFVSFHAKFGLASVIMMTITMLGGLGALYSLKLKQYLAPIYMKIIHATVGLVTFILGVITIMIAFDSDWWKKVGGNILMYFCWAMILTVMMITILRPSLKIYFRLKERLENTN